MDFFRITVKEEKDGTLKIYPDWVVGKTKDLMVQGGSFYAVWDEERGLWSRDEFDVARLVDRALYAYAKEAEERGIYYKVMPCSSHSSGVWEKFQRYMRSLSDTHHPLDSRLTFADTEINKEDYVTRRLPYSLSTTATPAWEELMDVLYERSERDKIEWAIGAVVAGDARYIQKFLVFYGAPGTGKSTILNIIQKLFEGYVTTFDAKALGNSNQSFATEVFKGNPLVAIQHDGDLSRINDNARLNSIIAHEEMVMNEKFKASYTAKVNAFLFMGTNQVVKISDAKSGIIRRLIDVRPSERLLEEHRYFEIMEQIEFELGGIAHRCMQRYLNMGKAYYSSYRATEMMLSSNAFANFIEWHFDIFNSEEGITLKRAYTLYKEYAVDNGIERLMPQYKFRDEFRNYFDNFEDRHWDGQHTQRSYFSGFKGLMFERKVEEGNERVIQLAQYDRVYNDSPLNHACADQPAQLANDQGTPRSAWASSTTTLRDIDPTQLHYVQLKKNHIVIDFDLVDEDGEKSLAMNLAAAATWPATYTELSKSGKGVHLHYYYTGDVELLDNVFDVGIEVKTLLGNSSLRRKLTKCNTLDIVTISGGLPLKEKKPVLDTKQVKSEKALRHLIIRNLKKEIHPGTKPSIEFIKSILDEAYEDGLAYNVVDMKPALLAFAAKSTNHRYYCIDIVEKMELAGKNEMEVAPATDPDAPLVFYDVEVYPNLFIVCWKPQGSEEVVKMVNPTPQEMEPLMKLKLVGFNNRRYDNHIIYGRYMGLPNEALYHLSQAIIDGKRSAMFKEAYNLSWADIYDFSSKKQGLKKFMIELGINHMEMDIPWDQPVPEDVIPKVIEYCVNDVRGTEAVFEARHADYVAREILAKLSGLTINHTTQAHTAKIIFGDDKDAQSKFIYTDLSGSFPGYAFDGKESTYRGEVTGEGGYVYAEPGVHENVALLDVASMHPTSAIELDLFGPYTGNFKALMDARLAIKNGDFERARSDDILAGRLGGFLDGAEGNPALAEALSYALKIVINIVYGLTSAKFDNPFRDIRNKDNIVAKRGALFMIDLKHALQERGCTVAHIKTDSVKIPNATAEDIEFVTEFGKEYGYDFEHEATYDKLYLANDAVYIARAGNKWTATGAQFQHPYVFKSLFTGEELTFDDYCETKNVVQGVMYLGDPEEEDPEKMVHVGRTGSFVPVLDGRKLWRVKEGNKYAVTGTKGHLWVERDIARARQEEGTLELDLSYFEKLAEAAVKSIEQYMPLEQFKE